MVIGWPAGLGRDITADFREARAERQRIRFDLIEDFERSTVEPESTVSTPSGRGVFVDVANDDLGTHPSLTMVSGFRYHAPPRTVERGDELCMRYRMPYPQSDGAGLRITATAEGVGPMLELRDG